MPFTPCLPSSGVLIYNYSVHLEQATWDRGRSGGLGSTLQYTSMACKLGAGNNIFAVIEAYHDAEAPAHGALADLAANSRDVQASRWRILGKVLDGGHVLCIVDDGPGPVARGTQYPTPLSLAGLVRPGLSTSTNDATKIGQAGIGTLSGTLALGDAVIFATASPSELFVLLVSKAYNRSLSERGLEDATLITLTCAKETHTWRASSSEEIGCDDGEDAAELFLRWTPCSSLAEIYQICMDALPPRSGRYSGLPPASDLRPPTSYFLPVTSCLLPPASYLLPPTSCILHPSSTQAGYFKLSST